MKYESLTQDEIDILTAEHLHARELEHLSFANQVAHLEGLLADLPQGPWPKHLDYLRKLAHRDKIVAAARTPEDRDEALRYFERDFHRVNCETARHECGKVERIHGQVLKALPAERRAEAFARAKAKREAAEQAARK